MKKLKEIMNKPVYLGLSMLEISKTLMYDCWYDYIKPEYKDKAKLCYMDTDSFTIDTEIEDIYKEYRILNNKRFWFRKNRLADYNINLVNLVNVRNYKEILESGNLALLMKTNLVLLQAKMFPTYDHLRFFNVIHAVPFRGCLRMDGIKRARLPKIPMIKFGTVTPYLKNIQKICKSLDTSYGFCWHHYCFIRNP